MIDTVALRLNKLAGALFEAIKMILIISVFLNLFQKINYNHLIVSEEKLKTSVFYRPIEIVSQKIFPLIDQWYKTVLKETAESIKYLQENNEK